MFRIRLMFLSASLLCGCSAAPPRTIATPATTPAAEADDNLNAVLWAQTAVEHDLAYREIYRAAREKLPAAIADASWDALPTDERTAAAGGLPPAVILDVDETVLDNSPYQARLVRDGREYDEVSWAQWCKQGSARPMPGALEFTRAAAARGVAVFYLSNRAQDLNVATLANLRAAGFPVAGDDAFLGLGLAAKGCEQTGTEKGCRRRIVAQRYRVVMQFGDQLGDFLDVLVNTPDGRAQRVAPYLDWIGARWFVLPNPTYGSWQGALFNNAWSAPAAQRRAALRGALRTD